MPRGEGQDASLTLQKLPSIIPRAWAFSLHFNPSVCNLNSSYESSGDLVKEPILVQQFWGRAWDPASLTRSQVMPMLSPRGM